MERENTEYIKFVCDTFEKLKLQFIEKHEQYSTDNPLADFDTWARAYYKSEGYAAKFTTALHFVGKHIAHVINHGINGNKVDESLKDIAIYMVIMLYMLEKHKEIKE